MPGSDGETYVAAVTDPAPDTDAVLRQLSCGTNFTPLPIASLVSVPYILAPAVPLELRPVWVAIVRSGIVAVTRWLRLLHG